MSQTTDEAEIATRLELSGRRVVDIGCGEGRMVRWLRSQGAFASGVECGEEMIRLALAADPDHEDDYSLGVAEDLPLDDESVDVVCFFRSLHHVPRDAMDRALHEAHRVLRPGGFAYFVEPVAAGPSFEVARLIDDETEVRRLAQESIEGAAGFEAVADGRYTTRATYADFAAWKDLMVGVDPSRAGALKAESARAEAAFHEHGEVTGAGWAFDQEQQVRVLRRRVGDGS